jgi:hypothetical protein
MSIEQGTIPTPSDDPFYDALIKRLWMDDDRTDFLGDQIYFDGSTEHVTAYTLSDYSIMGLEEAPLTGKRNLENRRALLARGIGCLTITMQVSDESKKRSYIVTRPADLNRAPNIMYGLLYMQEHYPALADRDLEKPTVFRFMPRADETIIDSPLEHPYLREVYEEIVGTF